jgi:hypothetical protein
MPQGVPFFCANPTVTTVATGAWSNPATWSTHKVPATNDKVAIGEGQTVTYDALSDVKIECVEVHGKLTFKTDASTRLKVVTILVLESGSLEIGSPARPVAPGGVAEIVIADQPFNRDVDPAQIGNGIVSLGNVTMHGDIKTPTFLRVSREPLAGQSLLAFEQAVTGWKVGDVLVIPDTRQLRDAEQGRNYKPQDEKVQVASISGAEVALVAPLVYDHKGSRSTEGKPELLPHVGNLSRNVIVRSENPAGTRGHTMFLSHAGIDIRYAAFKDLGRTKMGILNNTEFDSQGQLARIGTNQIGRYAVHFHHDFGPRNTPANGYQFTLIGNVVDGSAKWGITVHRSHWGLIQDNVVYDTRGAGIVTEDGSESFNVFDHNFSLRTPGSRDAVQGNGYSSVLPNPGADGSAFWFRGPNNYIRNNVAADAADAGFGLPGSALGMVRIPKFKGADTSQASESVQFNTSEASVLEFSNNEAYGAIQSGVKWGWSGTIANLTVWHASQHGIIATPTKKLVIEKVKVRGDSTVLASADEHPVGVWIANYVSRDVSVVNADIQGTRIGVASPFFYGQNSESSGGGSLTVEDSYFRTQVGVNIATSYTDAPGGLAAKKAVVRSSVFEPLNVGGSRLPAPQAISMNYGMTSQDARPRDPILVYDFNKQAGDNFRVYYSLQAPATVAPCHGTMPDIDGWVCKLD